MWLKRSSRPAVVLLAIGAVLACASPVSACAVCFGDPDSDMAKGAIRGVIFLAGVIGFVLVGIASIAVSWSRRARLLALEDEGQA